MANQTEKKQIDNVGSTKQLDTSDTHSRPHGLQGLDSGKCVGMGAPEHAPARCKRSLEQFLCLRVLPLVGERQCQIVRTRHCVRVLLAQYAPLRAKHLPLYPLRLRILPIKKAACGQTGRRPKPWCGGVRFTLGAAAWDGRAGRCRLFGCPRVGRAGRCRSRTTARPPTICC